MWEDYRGLGNDADSDQCALWGQKQPCRHAPCFGVIGDFTWGGPLTAPIPHAVLAGILIKVGIDIIDWSFLKRAHKISWKATGLMYGVLLLTVFVDLITAVAAGVFVANLLTVKSLTDLQMQRLETITAGADTNTLNERERELLHQAQGHIILFCLGGP